MPQEFTAPTMNNKTAHQNYVLRRQILDHGIYSLLDEKVSSLLSSNINNLIVHFEKPTPAYGLFQLEKRDELLAVPIQIVPRSTDESHDIHCSSTLKCLKTGTERVEDGFEAGLERYENAIMFFSHPFLLYFCLKKDIQSKNISLTFIISSLSYLF